jgi:hypothetical protein
MSRLAQAGLSSTASPTRACAKHQATAASGSVAWRCSATPVSAIQRASIAAGVAADQRHRARMAGQRRGQRRKVLALAVAAEDHHQLARRLVGAQAFQRRHRGADVGALAVVEGLDAADAADALHAVRLAAYSRRPCSMGASGQPMAVASASAASALAALWRPRTRSASAGIRRCRWISVVLVLALLQRLVDSQGAHQPGHAVLDHEAEVTRPLGRIQAEAQHRALRDHGLAAAGL